MFATDRDLLVLEPTLFRDVSFLAQELVRDTGVVAGGVLTLAGASFTGRGIAPGHVALIGRTPAEIIEITGPLTARVSLLRESTTDAPINPMDAAAAPVVVTTFRPQLALAHAQVLGLFGLRAAGDSTAAGPGEGDGSESAVTNAAELARFEALGALHLVYAAAAPFSAEGSAAWARAQLYRFARERWRIRAHLDLGGDGVPEVQRTANLSRLLRV